MSYEPYSGPASLPVDCRPASEEAENFVKELFAPLTRYANRRILHLTIKRPWFLLINEGIKTEEYREIKPYWTSRLLDKYGEFREYDIVRFINGYGRDAPTIEVEFNGIRIGKGDPEYGAPRNTVYIIELGRVIPSEEIFPT